MGLHGNFNTMALAELLEWVGACRKTGALEVEKNKICKRILFDEGRIIGCSSNDPATVLGQFLLSRGMITRDVLSEALRCQEGNGKNLGIILHEMGAIADAENAAFIQAKIEETIYGLFDWDDAVFRFYADAPPDPNIVEVDLKIKDILERGRRRCDDLKRSHQSIKGHELVLRATTDQPDLAGNKAAERIFGLIDGNRTVADILLHSHAPEFQVKRFLAALLSRGVVEIVEADQPEMLLVNGEPEPERDAGREELQRPPTRAADTSPREDSASEQPSVKPAVEPGDPQHPSAAIDRELQSEIKLALNLMSSGKPEGALELLNAMAKAHPNDVALRQLVTNAERDFWQQTIASELPLSSVLSPVAPPNGGPSKNLAPEESFLLDQIDGKADARTLIWLVPMRKVDALRTLCRMLKAGLIEKRGSTHNVETTPPLYYEFHLNDEDPGLVNVRDPIWAIRLQCYLNGHKAAIHSLKGGFPPVNRRMLSLLTGEGPR